MKTFDCEQYAELSAVFSLLGNALLTPANLMPEVVEVELWQQAPVFGSDDALAAADELALWCAQVDCSGYESLAQMVGVEYAQLFVGPPSPAVAPWETMHVVEGATCGFGEPTWAMRQVMRDCGLELSSSNHQFEDHMGVELLVLGELFGRAEQGGEEDAAERVFQFANQRPLGWIDRLTSAVVQCCPNGFYGRLLAYAVALLRSLKCDK